MKRVNLLGVCLLACAGIQASPLTPQQALERLNDGRMSAVRSARLLQEPVWTACTPQGTPAAYVFNEANGNGYRILSADDAAYAVLGYSDTGSIDPKNMSPELKWWLESLGAQMEYYISKGATRAEMAPEYAPMEPIAPLTKSKWDQGAPYYNECPMVGTDHTYTGCVATSMAQVMYYHKYPEVGTGSNSYYWTAGKRQLKMNFGEKAFDWDNMLDQYSRNGYNETQADAVAFLMKSCGYSVSMGYGVDGSGAAGPGIAYALKEYFNYSPNVDVKWRVTFSASGWANEIYKNLQECGPVILNGHPYQDAGHSFICDGYNGKGYFHFNWGWGGTSDGWFLLECLNPEAQGAGGAAMGAAYNYGLNGIFGIKKPDGAPVEPQYGNMLMFGSCTAEFQGNVLSFQRTSWYPEGWYCASDRNITVNMGAIIEPVDGTPGETRTQMGTFNGSTRVSSTLGTYFPSKEGPKVNFPSDLADGRYKVTIGVRDVNVTGAPYQPVLCPYGCANYVYVTIKDGEKTVENIPTPTLEPKGLVLETKLFYSRYAKYKATISNPSDFELTESLSPALLSGNKIVMIGGVTPLTCAPNSEADVEWDAKMSLVKGATRPTKAQTYTLAMVNPVTNEVLGTYGEVTMDVNPGDPTLRVKSFGIQNCEPVTETLENGSTIDVYVLPDSSDFTVYLDYSVWSGYFDGVLTGAIYKVNPSNVMDGDLVVNEYSERFFLEEEEGANISIPVDFTQGQKEDLYSFQFSYTTGSSVKQLRSIYFRTQTSGIDDVVAGNDEPVRYYNMQGMEIAEPVKGQIVIVKKGQTTSKVRF